MPRASGKTPEAAVLLGSQLDGTARPAQFQDTHISELEVEDPTEFRSMFRMDKENFDFILNLVAPLYRETGHGNKTEHRPIIARTAASHTALSGYRLAVYMDRVVQKSDTPVLIRR